MAAGRVKKREGENLTPATIEKVISLLEQAKPITKKEACEILNISYNTTRLTKVIEEHKEDIARDKKFRAANKGKPASQHEISTAISSYLAGDSVKEIADRLFRSSAFVQGIIDKIGVPSRKAGDYLHPELMPEACVSDTFEKGQVVWASRYNALAIVVYEEETKRDYKVYNIYVLETIDEVSPYFPQYQGFGGRHASQAAHDLGSLEHLKEYGVDVYRPLRPHFPNWLAGR